MKSCNVSFPVSINDQVFDPDTRKVGRVSALSISDDGSLKARVTYPDANGKLLNHYTPCCLLRAPRQSGEVSA